MAAPRASWKGFLKIGELTCAVGLYAAASTSSRIAFRTINRKTGNPVHRVYLDAETGELVENADQAKGYEISPDNYVILTPEEVASALPESDKTLAVSAFIPRTEVDDVFLDRPYYLAPADRAADSAYTLIREGLRNQDVVALTRTVLFRRVRTLLIQADEQGLIASTLHFDNEVRAAKDVFDPIPSITIDKEMLGLAQHIITTKQGAFDITTFEDRYEKALAELVQAKVEGRKLEPRKAPARGKVVDLREALRASAGLTGKDKPATSTQSKSRARAATPRTHTRKKAS